MTKRASTTAALLLLGMTCCLHVATAQPTPSEGGQKAAARTFDEDINFSELEGQPLIEYSNSSTRRQGIIQADNNHTESEKTLADDETSGDIEESSNAESNETVTEEKEIAPTNKSPLKAEKVFRTWAFLLKGLGVFYVLWAMVVPVLFDTNAFGITDITRNIKEYTQQFFSTNFFSLDDMSSKVDEAIQKYESSEELNAEMKYANTNVQNYTTDDTQETTTKQLENDVKRTVETSTKSTSFTTEDIDILDHNSLSPPTQELNSDFNNPPKNTTDGESRLDVIPDEEENEIDVNRQFNEGLNDILAGIQDNLRRRFVSSIHQNIVTLLRRTMFPKQQKSLAADQFRNDPVDIVLDLLNIENYDGSSCRERLVCDARRLVSILPYVSGWFGTPSSNNSSTSITRGYKYLEAAARGAARDDCGVYKCPYTSAQLVTGWL